MTMQTINLGTTANDGTGDTLRDAGDKINGNFTELYAAIAASGASWKAPVRAATVAPGTLATDYENGDTVDGVTLATGDRILIKNQSTASENGIYVVAASGAPTRSTDADTGGAMVNAGVFVSEGATNADTLWTCSTNAPITVGSTGLTFSQLNTTAFVVSANEANSSEMWTGTSSTKVVTPKKILDAAAPQTLTDGATVTPDFNAGFNFEWTIGGNQTLANPSNTKSGQSGTIKIVQDATGSRVISYGNNWRFPGGAATGGVLSTAANAVDLIAYTVGTDGKIYATLSKAFAA